MKRRIVSVMLALFLVIALLPATSMAASSTGTNYSYRPDYFINKDYFVIMPAEKWIGGSSETVPASEWELTAQDLGTCKWQDIQMYKYGVSDKFYISDLKGDYKDKVTKTTDITYRTFKIQVTNYQETKHGLYWDVQGASKKPGSIIHLWTKKDAPGDYTQRFYLEDDDDGDAETFYIKNLNADLYLTPKGYYNDPSNPGHGNMGENWDENETKLILTKRAFRWRIHILNHTVDGTSQCTDWMSALKDTTKLSQLSIPGTHDAGTANVLGGDVSGMNNVACQKYFIHEQLIAGVRAFDLRTNEVNDRFWLIHGFKIFPCRLPGEQLEGLTLTTTLDTMIEYLEEHPREALIVTLKIDDSHDTGVKRRLAKLLLNRYLNNPDKSSYFYQWSDSDTEGSFNSPTLNDVRGKIVLFKRVDFSLTSLYYTNKEYYDPEPTLSYADYLTVCGYTGPDLSKWDDRYNASTFYAQKISNESAAVKVYVQDAYEASDSDKQKHFFNTIDQINGSRSYYGEPLPAESDFVFNYTSKTKGSTKNGGLTPLSGSRFMNDLIFYSDKFQNSQRVGIVMMDYASKALAERVIQHNDIYRVKPPLKKDPSALKTLNATENSPIVTMAELEPLESEPQIRWPKEAKVTYGYTLGEAEVIFEDAVDAEEQNTIPGYIYFEDASNCLSVAESGNTQTLVFQPYDGSAPSKKQIPVTVEPRLLPISVGNYSVEYGDTFDITKASAPTAGGFFLPSDYDKLVQLVNNAGLHVKAVDTDGNAITFTTAPKPCYGAIKLTADNPEKITHPNYATTVRDGTWIIQPRTVSVTWSYGANGWEASIGNIINNDEVTAIVTSDESGRPAVLTLGGADAAAYQIDEKDVTPPPSANSFTDLTEEAYYYDAVAWAASQGIAKGTSSTEFSPNAQCTRAQTVTFLWRVMGQPEPESTVNPFTDVREDSYYFKAVLWAAEKGITMGVNATEFETDAICTRAQIITFFFRAAGYPVDGSVNPFSDVLEDATYKNAVAWAANRGITFGTSATTFSPENGCTRGQVLTFLYRFLNN